MQTGVCVVPAGMRASMMDTTGSATTKMQGVADTLLPDKVTAASHRRMAAPGSGE